MVKRGQLYFLKHSDLLYIGLNIRPLYIFNDDTSVIILYLGLQICMQLACQSPLMFVFSTLVRGAVHSIQLYKNCVNYF